MSSRKNKVFVADLTDFPPGKRHLIKYGGTRNIAVYNVKGVFYAMDNACYHHGGPLLNGDIETLGGHPCVKCPWHSYEISLATGEGLYWGIKVNPAGGKPERALQSKGKKQRVHPVVVRADQVFVEVDTSGSWESDGYAEMAIANREQAQMSSGSTGGPGIHSGLRSGQFLGRSGSVPFGAQKEEEEGGTTSSGPKVLDMGGARTRTTSGASSKSASVLMVKVTKVLPVSASGNTKMFVWEKVGSGAFLRRSEPGQYATVILPPGFASVESGATVGDGDDAPSSKPSSPETRTWTMSSVRGEYGGWFTTTVKKQSMDSGGRGGSAWLHERGLHIPLPLKEMGGNFHVGAVRERINGKKGYLLMISAGVGITPMFASINKYLNDPFTTTSGPPLHILHLHTEKSLTEVPFLGTLALWHGQFGRNNREENPVSYQFKLALSGTSTLSRATSTPFDAQPEYINTLPPSYQPGSKHSTDASVAQAMAQVQQWKDCNMHEQVKVKPSSAVTAADEIPNVTHGSRLSLDHHLLPACDHFADAIKRTVPGAAAPTSGSATTVLDTRDFMVMLCGPDSFTAAITEQLVLQCGVVRNNILTEAFNF